MDDIYQLIAELTTKHVACALCTVIKTGGSVPRHPGSKMLVDVNGAVLSGSVGGGAMEGRVSEMARLAIAEGKPRLVTYQLANPAAGDPGVCGGEVEVFIDPLLYTPTLIVFGAGHVGRALVHLAKWAGYRVVLSDDRAELCTPEACPGADDYMPGSAQDVVKRLTLSPHTYIAMVTRGYPLDVELLPDLVRSPVAYIGVIGSQRRWLTAVKALQDKGISETELTVIHAPIGIEIGAETPEEIAVSIMAEIIGHHRQMAQAKHDQPSA